MRYKLIQVDWEDSSTEGRWKDKDETEKSQCCQIRTVGYLVHRDKRRIIVSGTIDKDVNTNTDRILIPRGCIQRIRYLQEK